MPGGGSLNPASHETVDKKMHYIHQDGQQVFKYAVKKMAEMTERVLEKQRTHRRRRRLLHRAPGQQAHHHRHRRSPEDALEKVIINIDRYGNTTAGTHSAGHADRN